MFFARAKTPIPVEIDGVPVRQSVRARRMALRVDNSTGEVVLVWPRRGSEKSARRFVEENRNWIARQRASAQPARDFAPGASISVAGHDYTLAHQPGRGLTRIEGDTIVVCGAPEHFSRRLRDFLKKEAEEVLRALSDAKAATLGLKPVPIRVIDPKTRWGSCAHDGRLMYSWRLILAPPDVLDYVVAHEVAHRKHMNHGVKFWRLCAELSAGDAGAARRWLRREGRQLMAWR